MQMIVLDAKDLFFSYEQKNIIAHWSHSLQSQAICHIKGPNGSGKSTLLKLLCGILQPLSGSITTHRSPQFSLDLAYVGHQLGLHPDLSVRENLCDGLVADTSLMQTLLQSAGMDREEHTAIHCLSVGQKQKIAFIRMMMQKAMIWLLDEPFANLDEMGEAWLWGHIDKHIKEGGSVIFTAHQRHFEHQGVVIWQMS
jgi:heme exporter protein A